MSLFGKNIKKIRSVRGLTQAQLADSIDVSRGVISSYEEGRAEPKIETIIKTAEAFNLTIDQLLKVNLTVNQLSGFSIPEIPEKYQVNANNISKTTLLPPLIDTEAIPFAVASIHHISGFESTDILFAKPKPIDFEVLMLVQSKSKICVGKPISADAKTIEICQQTIKISDITNSYEVIGVYQSLKKEYLHERVQKLEQQMLEIWRQLNLK